MRLSFTLSFEKETSESRDENWQKEGEMWKNEEEKKGPGITQKRVRESKLSPYRERERKTFPMVAMIFAIQT